MGIATTTLSATTRQLSDGNSQGTVLGKTTTDLIAFYGAAPLAQQSGPLAVSTLTVSTVLNTATAAAVSTSNATTVWGYSSAAQANAIVTAINQLQVDITALQGNYAGLRTALNSSGLFKGS